MKIVHIGFHKDVFKPSLLKSTAVFLVFVFAWTNMGLYQVVYAATTSSSQHQVANTAPSVPSPDPSPAWVPPGEGQGEGLESLVKRIRERAEKAVGKIPFSPTLVKGERVPMRGIGRGFVNIESEKAGFQKEKSELEQADVNIREQFKQTEARIKGLPGIIQQRQKAFESKYEKNYAQLKSELDSINTAKTSSEFTARTRKLKAFLDKIKPPQRHIKLNPNKLPHRMMKPVWREPRMHYGRPHPTLPLRGEETPESPLLGEDEGEGYSPIQVASIGSLNGILSSAIVQTIPPPTAADLTSTTEVQFTPAILAKAAELNHNPVQIYNWVYNNIEYVPTYGSIQGADMCLQTMQCNDMDTASLLIALLRASNIPARYVYGTIQLPIDQVMNWVGGFTDPMFAGNLIASGGIPVKGVVQGGKLAFLKMEHVWVEAYVPYGNYRGMMSDQSIKTWIPLDASYKQYTYTQGLDINQTVPFNAQSFIDHITSTATINTPQNYATNIDSAYIQQQLQNYTTLVQNYISQNFTNTTAQDIIGNKKVIPLNFPFLPCTLPYQIITKSWESSQIPDSLRDKIAFEVINPTTLQPDISYTASLPEIAGKKITLSFTPATQADIDTLNSYLPQPNPNGIPIQPSQLPSSLPAYLIQLKPQLLIDGKAVAVGSAIGLGDSETFNMTFTYPNQSSDVVSNDITAGEYYGIAIDAAGISDTQIQTAKSNLQITQTNLMAQNFTGLTPDEVIGDLLYTTALSYYAQVDEANHIISSTTGIVEVRIPSEAIFSTTLNIGYLYGIPYNVSSGGLTMDVDKDDVIGSAKNGDTNKTKQYMFLSTANASVLESSVPEQLWSTPGNPAIGISAADALKIANDQGVPIYSINQTDMNAILPQLQLGTDVISAIQDAINGGDIVIAPKTNITSNGWTGCGYIIIDPTTGSSAYMISGGQSGAAIAIGFGMAVLVIAISAGLGGSIIGLIAVFLSPVYTALLLWLTVFATEAQRKCARTITTSLLSILMDLYELIENPLKLPVMIGSITISIQFEIDEIKGACF